MLISCLETEMRTLGLRHECFIEDFGIHGRNSWEKDKLDRPLLYNQET